MKGWSSGKTNNTLVDDVEEICDIRCCRTIGEPKSAGGMKTDDTGES
jgi:hypothetical protein